MVCDKIDPIDSENSYSCLSNHFDFIPAIDHKILKSTINWFWQLI